MAMAERTVNQEAAEEALSAHRVRAEAMRDAERGSGHSGLEAQMALVSARVTAEALARKAAGKGQV